MTPDFHSMVRLTNTSKVEFYFSAQNLATDEHMFKVLEGPKNTPVSIHHICTFKRMRHFKPYSAVVKALRESNDLDVVDDGEYSKAGSEAVKRKEPLSVPTKESDEKNPPTTEELFYRLKNNSSNNMERSRPDCAREIFPSLRRSHGPQAPRE
jgi:lupus La protein